MSGQPLYVEGTVATLDGTPLADALVDVWHADAEGGYDVQRPGDLAGRARLRTDAAGRFHFWTTRPGFYPVPHDGPVGRMLELQGRHPYRPAHVHFMIAAPGYHTLVTHVFADGDKYLDSDVVFGVKESIIREFEPHPAGVAPDGTRMEGPYFRLHYDFALAPLAARSAA